MYGEHDAVEDGGGGAVARHDKRRPTEQGGDDGEQYPRGVEGGVAAVEGMRGVVVVGTVGTLAPVLGTLVVVLLPAGAVHDVLALGHNLVALLKGCLAVVAGAVDLYAVVDHRRTRIVGDVAMYEHAVGDIRHDNLQHEVDEEDQHKGGHDAEQDDLCIGEAVDDDRRVDVADAIDGAGRADGPSVVVDGEV